MKDKRITFLNCYLDLLSMDDTLEEIDRAIKDHRVIQHVVLNAFKIVTAQKDAQLRSIINQCDLINADGQAIVWGARLLGHKVPERVAGIDLMLEICRHSAAKNWKIYLLGAREEVVKKTVENLKQMFMGIKIVGYRNGYFSEQEEASIAQQINQSGADILFVGISSPKKEHFLNRYLQEMNVPFVMGVGGSFDVVSGLVKRAPKWMQKLGLEWLYRTYQEPRRMWRRYATTNPMFVYLVLKELIRQKSNGKK